MKIRKKWSDDKQILKNNNLHSPFTILLVIFEKINFVIMENRQLNLTGLLKPVRFEATLMNHP